MENQVVVASECGLRIVDGRVTVTSLEVAERFGKRHKNVLQAIERLDLEHAAPEFCRLNFQPTPYLDEQGKQQVLYEMTRDGFALLAMGFTGREAIDWKIRFLEAFNTMERALLERSTAPLLLPAELHAAQRPELELVPARGVHLRLRATSLAAHIWFGRVCPPPSDPSASHGP